VTTPRPSLLLIEDDPQIQRFLTTALEAHSYRLHIASTGTEGIQLAATRQPDILIVDLGLPDISGLEVIQRVREWYARPIIVLSARDKETDKVAALDLGADDYLTKPFGVRELVARVRALLRRGPRPLVTTTRETAKPISYKHIEMDPARRRVRVNNTDVDLTSNEFQLLYVLLSSPGIVFSREALLGRVWKDQTFVTVRSVDTLIKRLRKKIERNPAEPEVILTVWGTGYKAADV